MSGADRNMTMQEKLLDDVIRELQREIGRLSYVQCTTVTLILQKFADDVTHASSMM